MLQLSALDAGGCEKAESVLLRAQAAQTYFKVVLIQTCSGSFASEIAMSAGMPTGPIPRCLPCWRRAGCFWSRTATVYHPAVCGVGLTLSDRWACSLILSRAFEIHGHMVVLPLIDALNHDPERGGSLRWNDGGDFQALARDVN